SLKSTDQIFGLDYLFNALVPSVIARNFAYLGNKKKFLLYAGTAENNINSENALTTVFSLTFIADGAIRIGLIDKAHEHINNALKIAKTSGLTTLNFFLFSMLGYIEVINGNKQSIQKIINSIHAAEDEKRLGRLPHYYLYLIKARKHISPSVSSKRLAKYARKLALNNSEMWVYSELSRYL
ncbi:MAG: hypothetical protein DI586_09180, partial [Micavibrio aeruginosavorus]